MTQLTADFTLEELGLVGAEERIVANYLFLCQTVLEPIRRHFNKPVLINSGFRCSSHNARVGGKPTSFHLADHDHAAADFHIHGVSVEAVFDWIRMESGLEFDKVIMECKNGVPVINHIQTARMRRQERRAFIGGTGDSHDYQEQIVK